MVFPAHAGVILSTRSSASSLIGFPRMRGGDPYKHSIPYMLKRFSPHARG